MGIFSSLALCFKINANAEALAFDGGGAEAFDFGARDVGANEGELGRGGNVDGGWGD